jgi:hypothetical protein
MLERGMMEFGNSFRIGSSKREMKSWAGRPLSFPAKLQGQFIATARSAISHCLIGFSGPEIHPNPDVS